MNFNQSQLIMDECLICFEVINENDKFKKWNCKHYFHKECIKNWNKNCPTCRCTSLCLPTNEVKENPYFNIRHFKSFAKEISSNKYINFWKKRDCIRSNHNLTFHQTYGVIGVCETCQTVQSFNLIK